MTYRTEQIREFIKCPQFGDIEYGKWGALNLEQRKAFKDLCDLVDSMDSTIVNLNKWLEDKRKYYYELYQSSENEEDKDYALHTYFTLGDVLQQLQGKLKGGNEE